MKEGKKKERSRRDSSARQDPGKSEVLSHSREGIL